MEFKLGVSLQFTAGADIGISQYVYTQWSEDEEHLLVFPTNGEKKADGISFSKARKGEPVFVVLKRQPPDKPSELDTQPHSSA